MASFVVKKKKREPRHRHLRDGYWPVSVQHGGTTALLIEKNKRKTEHRLCSSSSPHQLQLTPMKVGAANSARIPGLGYPSQGATLRPPRAHTFIPARFNWPIQLSSDIALLAKLLPASMNVGRLPVVSPCNVATTGPPTFE
jgi:hypothetical protein